MCKTILKQWPCMTWKHIHNFFFLTILKSNKVLKCESQNSATLHCMKWWLWMGEWAKAMWHWMCVVIPKVKNHATHHQCPHCLTIEMAHQTKNVMDDAASKNNKQILHGPSKQWNKLDRVFTFEMSVFQMLRLVNLMKPRKITWNDTAKTGWSLMQWLPFAVALAPIVLTIVKFEDQLFEPVRANP